MLAAEERPSHSERPLPRRGAVWFDTGLEARIRLFFESGILHNEDGSLFELLDWQLQIVVDVFCWKAWSETRHQWVRLYDEAYIEIPRQNGKSVMLSVVAILHLFVDTPGILIISIAQDEDQANAVFDVAKAMIAASPQLAKQVSIYKKEIQRVCRNGATSKYALLPGDADGVRSKHPTVVLFDEILTQKKRDLYAAAYGGMGAMLNPVIWQITTAGTYGTFAWTQHERAVEMLAGTRIEPNLYSVVFGIKPNEDWTDERVWERCNPSLGVTVDLDWLRRKFMKCEGSPAAASEFRKEHLNDWSVGFSKWLNLARFERCVEDLNEDDYRHLPCWAGVDLSSTTDTTAFTRLYRDGDVETGQYYLFADIYLPGENIESKSREDSQPYVPWSEAGFLTLTPGSVVDYAYVRDDFERSMEAGTKFMDVGFDRAMSSQIEPRLSEAGLTCTDVPQGAWLHDSIDEFERLYLAGRLHVQRNPLLQWQFSNVVVDTTEQDRKKVVKKKKRGRIDGPVAALNALTRALVEEEKPRVSVYETRGLYA